MSIEDNMKLWDAVCMTDPKFTKKFNRAGGFSGVGVSAEYMVRRATEQFGPFGGAWGIRSIKTSVVEGGPLFIASEKVCNEQLWVTEIVLFHPSGEVPGFGQTFLVTQNKNGIFMDEEAPKKSLTDALTKALSWLGFAADIHLGLHDDSRYMAYLRGVDFDSGEQPQLPPPLQNTQAQRPSQGQSRPVPPRPDQSAHQPIITPLAAPVKPNQQVQPAWQSPPVTQAEAQQYAKAVTTTKPVQQDQSRPSGSFSSICPQCNAPKMGPSRRDATKMYCLACYTEFPAVEYDARIQAGPVQLPAKPSQLSQPPAPQPQLVSGEARF